MAFNLIVRSSEEEPLYTRSVTARLARVSLGFLRRCEEEKLVQARISSSGQEGFSATDIRHLACIRRLREDLELDLEAIEVVLNLRRRVLDLLSEMDEIEQQMARREHEMMAEIQELRRQLAEEADWRW